MQALDPDWKGVGYIIRCKEAENLSYASSDPTQKGVWWQLVLSDG